MAPNIEMAFRQLSGTEKTQFINKKIDYASESTIANYVEQYALGVSKYISEATLIAMLSNKGHKGFNGTGGN
ncbi:hypothetical protein [uncultured Duncaniella sp.]|uniref:hypothetical protein n=1 Tax=uncultured Duncaniella sp. TaxID=2768039 RepID=UPI00266EF894|nr:hypothetical protein [uncultured Duncaniella sp.]